MAKTLFPLDIQLFAEEGAGAGGAAGEVPVSVYYIQKSR